MSSAINHSQSNVTYIYRQQKLYGKVEKGKYYLFENGDYALANDKVSEITDILPEGIDLQIMLNSFNAKNPIELLPYLKNTIGDFDFSTSPNKTQFDKPIMSNLAVESKFPNILDAKVDITYNLLHPQLSMDAKQENIQNLSLSGYQHKLQVNIIDNVIKIGYGDFILKPNHARFFKLPINEHLNVSFMKEFGFEVPFNALAYEKYDKEYHYLIKRFDIDKDGNKLPQISLNALMKHTEEEKYKGSIEEISTFLKDRLDSIQKMQFLKFIYANALLYNNDLHKKNIGFLFKNSNLELSPIYDILNIYAIESASKFDTLGKNQCVLTIKGHIDGIQISYFRKSCNNLGLDFDKVKHSLEEIQHIYLEKYPLYIEKLRNIPHTHDIAGFSKKLLESHNKCLKIAKRESKKSNLLSAREKLNAMPKPSAEKTEKYRADKSRTSAHSEISRVSVRDTQTKSKIRKNK
ncbi:HipA domain-containing protein [Helicobacter sp. T3_23-1059]